MKGGTTQQKLLRRKGENVVFFDLVVLDKMSVLSSLMHTMWQVTAVQHYISACHLHKVSRYKVEQLDQHVFSFKGYITITINCVCLCRR